MTNRNERTVFIAALLAFCSASSWAADAAPAPASKASAVVTNSELKVRHGAEKAASAVGHGVQVAASGAERGVNAAGRALEKTARKIGLPPAQPAASAAQ
jgi:hypothetical protein